MVFLFTRAERQNTRVNYVKIRAKYYFNPKFFPQGNGKEIAVEKYNNYEKEEKIHGCILINWFLKLSK